MASLGVCQNMQAPKVESKKGVLSCSILEIHNQIDIANKLLCEIEECVFVPRSQAICNIEERPQALTVDQKLYEVYMRLDGLNQRLQETNEAVQSELGVDLKLV